MIDKLFILTIVIIIIFLGYFFFTELRKPNNVLPDEVCEKSPTGKHNWQGTPKIDVVQHSGDQLIKTEMCTHCKCESKNIAKRVTGNGMINVIKNYRIICE